jgi:hypothetical protein
LKIALELVFKQLRNWLSLAKRLSKPSQWLENDDVDHENKKILKNTEIYIYFLFDCSSSKKLPLNELIEEQRPRE